MNVKSLFSSSKFDHHVWCSANRSKNKSEQILSRAETLWEIRSMHATILEFTIFVADTLTSSSKIKSFSYSELPNVVVSLADV